MAILSHRSILSFASLPEEIDTLKLNTALAFTGRLLLPKIADDTLKIYRVSDLDAQLRQNHFGLFEPIPSQCQEVSKEEVDIVLVPALGFDKTGHRLGFGKGYYDRFLASIPNCPTIGIGFKEQEVEKLPVEETDFPLTSITLF